MRAYAVTLIKNLQTEVAVCWVDEMPSLAHSSLRNQHLEDLTWRMTMIISNLMRRSQKLNGREWTDDWRQILIWTVKRNFGTINFGQPKPIWKVSTVHGGVATISIKSCIIWVQLYTFGTITILAQLQFWYNYDYNDTKLQRGLH